MAPVTRNQIPNALTLVRVVLAVVFFALLTPYRWSQGTSPDWWLIGAGAIFIIAAITDAADGYLARKWNAVSPFGRIMDPFADKILVLGAFVMLAGPAFARVDGSPVSGVAPWMAIVMLGRELLVTSIRGVLEGQGVSFAATWSGKFKMILQSVCVPAVLIAMAFERDPDAPLLVGARILVYVTVAVTAWSGLPYITNGVRAFRDKETDA